MHARFYNPQIGRFLSTDPIDSASKRNPQSWNKYTYALNNPLKFVDPDGRTVVGFTGFGNGAGGVTQVIDALQGFEDLVGPARVFRWQDKGFAERDFIRNAAAANPDTPTVLLGHSLGARSALGMSRLLGNTPVDLLLTVDLAPHPLFNPTVPANVGLAINFYQPGKFDLGGTRLRAADPTQTRVFNIEAIGTGHTTIDERVAFEILGDIIQLATEDELETGLQFFQGELVYVRP